MDNYFEQLSNLDGEVIETEIGPWELTIQGHLGIWRLHQTEENQVLFYEKMFPFVETSFGPDKNSDELLLKIKMYVARRVRSWTQITIKQEAPLAEMYLEYCNAYFDVLSNDLKKWGPAWMEQERRVRNKQDPYSEYRMSPSEHSAETAKSDSVPIKHLPSLEQALATNSPKAIIDVIKSRGKLTPDEAIDVGQKAHELKSNILLNLLKQVPIKESIEPFKDFYNDLICEKTGTTSYGCLMAVLPKDKHDKFISFAKSHIDKENLADDGYENEPHVTVLYGFHGDLSKELKSLLHKWGDIEFTLGKISRFKAKDKDVIKVEAESEDIKKLHGFLMEHYKDKITTDFPKWKGHLTLAYVKSGAHKELDGDTTFDGKKYKFQELIYSTPGMHKKVKIGLVTD